MATAKVQMFKFSVTNIIDDWQQVCQIWYVGKLYIYIYICLQIIYKILLPKYVCVYVNMFAKSDRFDTCKM